ncbi:MAG: HAMP domain-containing histidine kinase [Actinobacteria bacterium]|nr:HAMP domain-containing histidine kinase [Actinomycetota bacterium]
MLLLAVVALEVPLIFSLNDRVQAEVRTQARGQTDVVAASVADLVAPPRERALRQLVASAASSVRGRVIVLDLHGRLLADSAGGPLGTSYADRPEVRAALRGRSFQSQRGSQTLGQNILATAAPVLRGTRGTVVGAVRITQSVAAVRRAVRRSTAGLLLVGAIVLALGLLAGSFIAGQFVRPIRHMRAAAARVAAGDLDTRVALEGSTEERSLARSFNDMTDRIRDMLTRQQAFVADASHQLRTPLAGLRLRLEEAEAAGVSPEAAAELAAGEREVDRIAELVEELLVLSSAGEPDASAEPIDLAGAAAAAHHRWEPLAREQGRQVVLLEPREPALVSAARADVDRVLDALVENALRYAPAGSIVSLRASGETVEVLDGGPGIAADEEEAVFERFHRGAAGRRTPGGTGLGLTIARTLARRWAGDVTIANRADGAGARALLRLPRLSVALPERR